MPREGVTILGMLAGGGTEAGANLSAPCKAAWTIEELLVAVTEIVPFHLISPRPSHFLLTMGQTLNPVLAVQAWF